MLADAALTLAIEATLAARVVRLAPVSGGDIDRALRVELDDGRAAFVKVARDAAGGAARLRGEAAGLEWLAAAGAIGVPRPFAVLDAPAALVLPWLERGAPTPASQERLGRELAALHRAGAPAFGSAGPGWLATIEVDNTREESWARFYGERRLVPLARAAEACGGASARVRRRVETLAARLDDRVGPPEPPARCHGDLWGGNHLFDPTGRPFLFDPCAYGAHREVDLAMMHLFGGFSPRTFAAYAEAAPLAPGHAERVPLYQLLPLLAHCVLFGGSWSASVEGVLDELGA